MLTSPTPVPAVVERRFAAMGTRVHVLINGGPAELAHQACAHLDELEGRWSRFRTDSDISRLNRADGRPVQVSPDTFHLVQRACQAWHLSDGVFDPTVLVAMLANGYDRPFAGSRSLDRGAQVTKPEPAPGCAEIDLDDRSQTVALPVGVGFDPGGIGKGLAADMVAGRLMRRGARGCLVSVGGDLVARGEAPDEGGWTVAITEPALGSDATISFSDGAVATSTTARRTWTVDGGERHHLIDPGSGAPMQGDVVLATAVACEGWLAEITTKALIARRVSPALASVPALVLEADGTCRTSAGMEDYLS
jgi:thiamine biosynthesis lipoprotein